ncbi:MAG: CinA family protein [Anaerolineae bacterium]|nr:CinA family protein [Anaerolineae bacterium]
MGSSNDELIEVRIGRLLCCSGMTLAVAESCTGGLVGHRITNVAGSSAYFLGSIGAYSYPAKESVLGVPHATLMTHGAVSIEVARAMAAGVRAALGADIGLSVTGVAGPGGGTPGKPVGLVYVALDAPERQQVLRLLCSGDRIENKTRSAQVAMDLLYAYLESRCAKADL